MDKISKKIVPTIMLTAILLIAGGFCNESVAAAAVSVPAQDVVAEVGHPIDCTNEDKQVEKSKPVSKTLMPCCVERNNNSNTIVPTATQDRINLSAVLMAEQVIIATDVIDQKTYLSSKSPPKKADILSSVVKIE